MSPNEKPTPGPWYIHRGHRTGNPTGIGGKSGVVIRHGGIAKPASVEGEANARLIAAAPALREALEDIEGFLLGQELTDRRGASMKFANIARAALSLAEPAAEETPDPDDEPIVEAIADAAAEARAKDPHWPLGDLIGKLRGQRDRLAFYVLRAIETDRDGRFKSVSPPHIESVLSIAREIMADRRAEAEPAAEGGEG